MDRLIPAHAGVIPVSGKESECAMAYPRARGGDPNPGDTVAQIGNLSPRTRG